MPAAWRIEVFRRAGLDDPDGVRVRQSISELGLSGVDRVRSGRGYLLPPSLSRASVERIAAELLADPVIDEVRIAAPAHAPLATGARLLVTRKAGVMDPVAQTVERAIAMHGLCEEEELRAGLVRTFRAFEFEGNVSRAMLEQISRRLLANEVIEIVLCNDERLPYAPPPPPLPRHNPTIPLRGQSDADLRAIAEKGELSLSLLEMRAIAAHFDEIGRDPTACELETIAQTWSEHCKHKTFTGRIEFEGQVIDNLLKETIQRATSEIGSPFCVSVFHDNAGIIAFDRGYDLAFKVETHNHPSAIDPYGGAGTGLGGVIRDILGVGRGAFPIACTDAFFVGPPDLPPHELPRGTMHPRRILRGVVAGVRDYGNRMGIPTVNGGVWFDRGYVANPLVYCGTLGILPHEFAFKEVRSGDLIVLVGGRTGRDGIHGATFSSAELHEESETVSSSAVQIGDPITEKKVLDALMVARDRQLFRALTDCGAGGLSSAVGEMGERCGAEVDLSTVPLKYPGLTPAEVWISEAQERMVLAVPPEQLEDCLAAFAAEDVEATVIGRFTSSKRLVVSDGESIVCDLDMGFLHKGTPRPLRRASWRRPQERDPGAPPAQDAGAVLLSLLAHPEVASKEWIVRQYDHEVQGTSVVKPLVGPRGEGPSDGCVLQPLADSPRGVAIACGANPRYGELDPAAMAGAVIDEALRNAVAVGGNPDWTAILDNFSWGNCEREEQLGALVLAAKACAETAIAFRTPFISGKDSLNNEYRLGDKRLAIPPTLLISALSRVDDVARSVTMEAKRADDIVYLVGRTRPELGGSLYHELLGLRGGNVPRPDLEQAPALLRALHEAIRGGLVRACHDLSEGGLAVAAAEMAFAGDVGLVIEMKGLLAGDPPDRYDAEATALFSESCTRFLVEIDPSECQRFEACFARHGAVSPVRIGRTTAAKRLEMLAVDGSARIRLPLEELRKAHRGGFQG